MRLMNWAVTRDDGERQREITMRKVNMIWGGIAAFSMKVTMTSRDCDKVNQIVPIMQEHLGPVMNLARIKLLAFVLHALCIVQTVLTGRSANITMAMRSRLRAYPARNLCRRRRLESRSTPVGIADDILFGCVIPSPPKMSGHGICSTASSSDRNVSTTSCFCSKVNMSTWLVESLRRTFAISSRPYFTSDLALLPCFNILIALTFISLCTPTRYAHTNAMQTIAVRRAMRSMSRRWVSSILRLSTSRNLIFSNFCHVLSRLTIIS